jgi:hypothetical protein
MNKEEYWDWMMLNEIATEAELQLVCNINGYSTETLDSVLYARTGNRSVEQHEQEDEG